MSEINNKWVVEYSVNAQTVHVQTVEKMLQANLLSVLEGRSNDYIPIAIADTPQAAQQQADQLEAELAKRRKQPRGSQ